MVATSTTFSPSSIKLFRSRAQEQLLEGGARTGKSFTLCYEGHTLASWFPGCKILMLRQTRKSLNHSILTIFEDILGPKHPALLPRRQKKTRDEYVYPYAECEVDGVLYKGSSEIHLIGMDNPERLMSTEYDVIMAFEATELTLRAWSLALSRLSNGHMPWNFMVADCNPAHENHWLNMRANEFMLDGDSETGTRKMHRICTKLTDNPKMWDAEAKQWTKIGTAYNKVLDNLPPLERGRLRDGLWISSSGQVFQNWRPDKHIVQGKLVKRASTDHMDPVNGRWWLEPVVVDGLEPDFEARPVAYFGAAVDWGYLPDPGAAALYAVDDHQRSFVVEEFYTTSKPLDWWAKQLVKWQKDFDVRVIVCEHPQERVDTLNAMLGNKLSVKGRPIAQLAKKGPGSVMSGIDVLRWCLDDDEEGEPRLRYLATASQIDDPYLRDNLLPTSGAAEYGSYVFHTRVDGKPNREQPVDKDNHGIDRDRYWSTHLWENPLRSRPEPSLVKNPGTLGAQLNLHKKVQDAFRAATKQ